MPKRYTDTEKWKKAFIKSLPPEYKLLWVYITDECDHSGIWHIEMDLAELRLGIKLSKERAQGLFSEKVVVFDNGNKWFLPDFVKIQYGELSEGNKVHSSVIKSLIKYDLKKYLDGIQGPLEGPKDKDKEMDKDKVSNLPRGIFLDAYRPDHAPIWQNVEEFFVLQGKPLADAIEFFNYYEGLGWKKGISAILSWRSFANRWEPGKFKTKETKSEINTGDQKFKKR